MSIEVVRELSRNLENVLHDRLKVIEEVLLSTKQTVTKSDFDPTEILERLSVLEGHFKNLDDYTMGEVRTLAYNHDMLEKRVESLENSMKSAVTSFQTINETISMMQKRLDAQPVKQDEKPVEAVEVEVEEAEAQDAEAEQEEEEEEEQEAEEEGEEEAEEEYDHIFTFGKKDYYIHKETQNVYIPDEEGGIDPDAIVGIWNPKTERMWMPDKGKWWDYKTNKYTDPKTKK